MPINLCTTAHHYCFNIDPIDELPTVVEENIQKKKQAPFTCPLCKKVIMKLWDIDLILVHVVYLLYMTGILIE